jgi:hypothetical protein
MLNNRLFTLIIAELKKLPLDISEIYYPEDLSTNATKYFSMEGRLPTNIDCIHTNPSELEEYVEIKKGTLGKRVDIVIRDGNAVMFFKNKDKFLQTVGDAETHLRHMQNHIDYEVDQAFRAALGKFLNEAPLPKVKIAKSESRALKGFKDFSNIEDATTLVRVANSAREGVKIGDREPIGYWVIDIINGTVVPVARSDEHHMGMDFVRSLVEKGSLPDSIYIPIWGGNQIIWNLRDFERVHSYIRAYRIWLANGGEDFFIEITNPKCVISMSEFVKCGGEVKQSEQEESGLTKQAKSLVRSLNFIADALSRHRSNRDFKENSVWEHADEVVWLAKNIPALTYDVKVDTEKYKKIKDESDYKELEQFIFAFNGIKNQIHILVKEQVFNEKAFSVKDFKASFGNLKEFERNLSSISEVA